MKRLSTLLIILGIVVGSLPFINDMRLRINQQNLITEAEKNSQTVNENTEVADSSGEEVNFQSINAALDDYDQERDYQLMLKYYKGYIGEDDIANSYRPQDNRLQFNFIPPASIVDVGGLKHLGTIEIPSINLSMPLVDGTADEDIAISAGHMIGTAYPDQIGNCVIVGHRGYSFGRLFNRLDELAAGDVITVTVDGVETTYTTYLSKVILPTDLSVINQTDKAKVLTLITCTPLFSSDYRLVIHAVKK